MKKIVLMMLICVCALAAVLPGCADSRRTEDPGTESPGPDLNEGAEPADPGSPADEMQGSDTAENESEEGEEEENMDRKVIVEVNGSRFTATLENNEAVDALVEMMREKPVTIQMSDYAGFEKVGPLGTSSRQAAGRQRPRRGISCCIRETRSLSSTVLIHGATQGWGKLMT